MANAPNHHSAVNLAIKERRQLAQRLTVRQTYKLIAILGNRRC